MIYDPIMLNIAYAPAAYYPSSDFFPVGGIGIGVYRMGLPEGPIRVHTALTGGRVVKFSPAFPQVGGVSATV
jgi:hypothetical protein